MEDDVRAGGTQAQMVRERREPQVQRASGLRRWAATAQAGDGEGIRREDPEYK